jgi:molecular chaperone DnaK (HSP70)
MADAQDLKGRLILGIDLGTTYSAVSVWDEKQGRVVMLPDAEGRVLLPSVVAWDRDRRDWRVGWDAEEVRRRDPARAASSIKRFLGRRFTEPAVMYGRKDFAYQLTAAGGGDPLRDLVVEFDSEGPVVLSAPEVSARVLAALRRRAADALGVSEDAVRDAVVTVPAYFNDLQRKATLLAGELAGLNVVGLLNEPTAAALAYGDAVLGPEQKRVLVLDLGGGTFDVSLLEACRHEAGYVFCTRVVDGDTYLGGDDIDTSVAVRLAGALGLRADDPATRDALRVAAERAKVALSEGESVAVGLPGAGGLTLTRAELEECAAEVRRRVRAIARRAVIDVAGLAWRDLDEVILVGGQVLMPAFRRDVEELTGRPPRVDGRAPLAVALGAGAYAHILSLGRERFHENTLINVIALPLGIELEGGVFEALVPANATVPHVSRPFPVTTTEDYQTAIEVKVMQGPPGATRAEQCLRLGSVPLEVTPAPAGTPKFEVTFDVREDGTMRVEVCDTRRDRRAVLDVVRDRVLTWRDGA